MRSTLRTLAGLVLVLGLDSGCSDDDAAAGGESTGFVYGDAWVQPGHGKEAFHPIAEGDDYPISLGGQGAYMFTLPLRAGGFALPDPDWHWTDPRVPKIDVWVDVEGWEGDLDDFGHFSSVFDYPILFRELDGGSYEYVRVSLLLPDQQLDFDDIVGKPVTLHYALSCGDGQLVENELHMFVSLSD